MDAEDIKARKKNLRREMQTVRETLGAVKRNELSDVIQRNLISLPLWQKARRVALYVAMGNEAATNLLLENAWGAGKTALLPKVTDKKAGIMRFIPCNGSADLETGAYGILEPRDEGGETQNLPPDLLLVPGLAFDRRGYRLGYGGGYYDRFLSSHKDWTAPRIALAFAAQLVENVPTDKFDCPLNGICTENGLLWF